MNIQHFYPESWASIKISGAKAGVFLQGQFSADILALPDQQACFSLLLNNKGKIRASFYVLKMAEHFKLWGPSDCMQTVFDHLQPLAKLSRVAIEYNDTLQFLHLLLNENLEQNSIQSITIDNLITTALVSDRFGSNGLDVGVTPHQYQDLLSYFAQNQIQPATAEFVNLSRIKMGIPLWNVDYTIENLPQEAQLFSALSFTKGCYLGQEIIARLHYRGHVNKKLMRFSSIESPQEFLAAELYSENSVAGRLTSWAYDDSLGKYFALGYVQLQGGATVYSANGLLWTAEPYTKS